MVLAVRPASLATSTKLTPRSAASGPGLATNGGRPGGNPAATICSNFSTNAVRLKLFRKSRREEDNRAPGTIMLEFAPILDGMITCLQVPDSVLPMEQ